MFEKQIHQLQLEPQVEADSMHFCVAANAVAQCLAVICCALLRLALLCCAVPMLPISVFDVLRGSRDARVCHNTFVAFAPLVYL